MLAKTADAALINKKTQPKIEIKAENHCGQITRLCEKVVPAASVIKTPKKANVKKSKRKKSN